MNKVLQKKLEEFDKEFCVMLERAGIENGEGESAEEWQIKCENFITSLTTTFLTEEIERLVREISNKPSCNGEGKGCNCPGCIFEEGKYSAIISVITYYQLELKKIKKL